MFVIKLAPKNWRALTGLKIFHDCKARPFLADYNLADLV